MTPPQPTIVIVLPIYNEEVILWSHVNTLHAYCTKQFDSCVWTIVIADNGSSDTSEEIGKKLASELPQVIYDKRTTQGRGGALQQAWSLLDADVYIYMDSDLATDLRHLPELIRAIMIDDYDIAVGSRLIKGSSTSRSLFRGLCSHLYSAVPKVFFPTFLVRDCQCGFKAISNRVKNNILPLVKDVHWFFDTELLIRAHINQYRIAEIPVDWRDQRYAPRKSKVKLWQTALENMQKLWELKKELP